MSSAIDDVAPPWMHQIKATEISTASCKWVLSFNDIATEIERKLSSGGEPEGAGSALDDAKKLDTIRPLWDVTLVVDRETKPRVSARLSFDMSGWGYESGEVAGEAYLYDYRAEKVVCAGYVLAKNSETVKFDYKAFTLPGQQGVPLIDIPKAEVAFDDAVKRDFRIATHRRIVESLRLRTGSW